MFLSMLCVFSKSRRSCSRVMILVSFVLMPFDSQYLGPISANDGGAMRHLRFVQSANASSLMVVRPSGKVTKVSPVHP